ncbi:MAG: DinB family protein [Chloroflexota bacterium]
MDALVLLREQVARSHDLLTQVFAEVTVEQAIWKPAGSTTNPIVATFLHVASTEDRLTHRASAGQPTVFETGEWGARLHFDPGAVWSPIAVPDLPACRAYAAEVHTFTREFLEGLDSDSLQKEIDTPRGRRTLLATLSLALVTHKLTHLGEIAALLGCQGVKGFPF